MGGRSWSVRRWQSTKTLPPTPGPCHHCQVQMPQRTKVKQSLGCGAWKSISELELLWEMSYFYCICCWLPRMQRTFFFWMPLDDSWEGSWDWMTSLDDLQLGSLSLVLIVNIKGKYWKWCPHHQACDDVSCKENTRTWMGQITSGDCYLSWVNNQEVEMASNKQQPSPLKWKLLWI